MPLKRTPAQSPSAAPQGRYRRARLRPLPGSETWSWRSPQGRRPLTLSERLWPKVWGPWADPSVGPDDCWLWSCHAVDGWSYGRIYAPTQDEHKRLIGAHVAAYLLVVGPIPPGQLLWHLCHEHLCCNPRHLVPGSAAENSADIAAAGRPTGHRAHRRRAEELAA